MRLYVLDGGRIEVLNWQAFQPDAGPGVRRWLSNSCYLVVHPAGTLLWDTGLPGDLADRPDGLPVGDIAIFHVRASLAAQLVSIGHPPDSIGMLALSHLHRDHVGNVSLFRSATLLVQEDEYAAGFGSAPERYGYVPASYEPLRDMQVTLLHADHDVFGDGSVVIKRLAGHTPGSQSLLVRLPETGTILISGDLVHSLDNWRREAVPGLNYAHDESVRSMREAAHLLKATRATLWVQHDLEQQSTLRHPPHWYS